MEICKSRRWWKRQPLTQPVVKKYLMLFAEGKTKGVSAYLWVHITPITFTMSQAWRDKDWWHVSTSRAFPTHTQKTTGGSAPARISAISWWLQKRIWESQEVGVKHRRHAEGRFLHRGFCYNSCPDISHKQPPRGIKCEDLDGKNGSSVCLPPTLYDRGQVRSPRAGAVGPKPCKRRLK